MTVRPAGDQLTVLVAGGAGGVGEGIVRALLASSGVRVVVSSRTASRLAMLRERVAAPADGRLVLLEGDAGSPGGAQALAERIDRDIGEVDVAIPSLGGWWEGGRFLDVDAATWDRVMHEMLGTHVVFARTFLPRLIARRGRYLGIGGGAGLRPIRNASIVSVAAAAQIMLTRALAAELTHESVEIVELVVDGPVRTRESEADAAPEWITADEVGDVVAALVRREPPPWSIRTEGPILVMPPRGRRKR